MKAQKSLRRSSSPGGFSLIIVIALMVLLSLLAVGLLGLSSVTLRSSRGGDSMAEARANARMAMMIAIGNIQKSLGPDQRVTANSSAINGAVGEANALGVWKSWHWDPEASSSPDYGDKRQGFMRWLASSENDEMATSVRAAAQEYQDPVWLINPDTVGNTSGDTDQTPALRAERQRMELSDSQRGGLAWAVMDESQKVSLGVDAEQDGEMSRAELIAQRVAPQRPTPEVFLPGMQQIIDQGTTDKIVSLETASLALGTGSDKAQVLGRQQSITTQSIGLLTDVAEGGLKWDLTSLLDDSSDPASVLGRETLYFSAADGAPTWDYIKDHYQYQEEVTNSASGAPTVELSRNELRPIRNGIDVAPTTEKLLPVIAKMQIVFSIVTHYAHISDRVNFFNTQASPRGNTNYGCPHLVYDPVVTLWNPYDVAIELDHLRVQISDPPVLFGFKKNGVWLRPDFASQYQGLARFQIANERDASARKNFILYLTDSRRNQPGATIRLEPGEVKVFSPWIETNWTWGLEVGTGDYSPRAFFDWQVDKRFGTIDGRTKNQYGIETVPGWDPRGGLQTDHLAYAGGRPVATQYAFERSNPNYGNQGWLGINVQHEFSVHCKPGRAFPATGSDRNTPDFVVQLLAGQYPDADRDLLRTYQFRFNDVASEIGSTLNGEIERTYVVGDLLQSPTDKSPGGKTPFALFTMGAKTTRDTLDFSKPWMHAHPVVEGGEQDSRYVGNALDSYDVSLQEMSGFYDFPNIEVDPGTNRGFLGGTSYSNGGVSNVPMFHIPVVPCASLGDLIPANLIASGALPRVTHPFGNSYSHPLISTDSVYTSNPIRGTLVSFGNMLDHSYLLNDALWDRYFFSTIGDISNAITGSMSTDDLLKDFMDGNPQQLNRRLVPLVSNPSGESSETDKIGRLGTTDRAQQIAGIMGVKGAFNVNSDSKEAWWAVLSSLRDREVLGWGNSDLTASDKTAYPRSSFPLAGDPNQTGADTSVDVAGARRWAGFRALTDTELNTLAEEIVDAIRQRGSTDQAPFATVAEFVNRRIGGASGLHTVKGLLQTAIEDSGINESFHQLDSNEINGASDLPPNATKGEVNSQARLGYSAEGAPSIISQGDLMMALAPVITVRGDTFRIRAYGESRDKADRITANAWCEAVVQRLPEYLDPVDDAYILPDDLDSEVNQKFGRRFIITSFRWLSPEEI
ncbi:hypothetical protein HNR46_000702 [Haloferula luteola]|uniref:Verru_Chthon cassette protein A n=1 Tax=Haloferula luteola TaxID=595692 RepID=A0A840V6U7_9BACT|nr:hypothetical protein [Haloferula luteola]MBB5350478.1 hypothetical protein [Haloferula luteola]